MLWIVAAVGAVAFLADKLLTAKSAAQGYADSVQKALGALPVTQLSVNLAAQQATAMKNLSAAQARYNATRPAASSRTSGRPETLTPRRPR